jgi:hypothetical protein
MFAPPAKSMPQLMPLLQVERRTDQDPDQRERNGGEAPFDEVVFWC